MELRKDNNIVCVQRKYDEFEIFKTDTSNWLLDFKQLDSGKFNGELMLMDCSQVQLINASLDRKFEQHGVTPAGYRTFAIPADAKQKFQWRGHSISGNNLLVYPNSGEIDGVNDPGFNIFTISIANNLIDEFIEIYYPGESNILTSGSEVLNLSPAKIGLVRRQLQYLISQVNEHPEKVNTKAFKTIFIEEVPALILNNVLQNDNKLILPASRIRDIALGKAVDYIRANTKEMPAVKELCLIAGASSRTLEYAFKEKYGIGPKDYMRKQLLNKVHQDLIKADPNHDKIKNVAQKYGFWHMGQFGADYKKLFMELPSASLTKNSRK